MIASVAGRLLSAIKLRQKSPAVFHWAACKLVNPMHHACGFTTKASNDASVSSAQGSQAAPDASGTTPKLQKFFTPYELFLKEIFPKLKAQHPGAAPKELLKMAASAFKKAPKHILADYTAQSAELKQAHLKHSGGKKTAKSGSANAPESSTTTGDEGGEGVDDAPHTLGPGTDPSTPKRRAKKKKVEAQQEHAAASEEGLQEDGKTPPKRRASGYQLFIKENFHAIRDSMGEGTPSPAVMKQLAATWKGMGQEEKDGYNQRAKQL